MSLVNQQIKISLTHKNKISKKKAMLVTNNQEAPQSTFFSASVTVEAAMVFPLVLFVLLFFISFFRVMQVQQMTAEALSLTGARASLKAEEPTRKSLNDTVMSGEVIVEFLAELKTQGCSAAHVTGGWLGFDFRGSSVEGEYINLRLSYRMTLPGGILDRIKIPVVQQVRLKNWTGYHGDGTGLGDDEWIYVTKDSNVYHLTSECTHLKLSIQSISGNRAESAGYTPCSLCGDEAVIFGSCYVTNEGKRYHTKLSCSGLKRTVYMRRRSEVGGKSCCSRCKGG